MNDTLYNRLYSKSNIKHPKDKNTNIFCLSDLQIPQKNLLKYENFTRIELAGLIKDNEYLTLSKYEKLSDQDQEYYTIRSSEFIIEQYKKYIVDNLDNFNVFVDLGDFIFNITQPKIDLLSKYGLIEKLMEIFQILRDNNKHTILILGNHDKIEYKQFYYNFFDEIKEFGTTFINDEFTLYTHYPFLKSKYNKETDSMVPENKTLYNGLQKLIEEGKVNEPDIVNIHGHLHSSKIVNIETMYNMSYINRCIDYLLYWK